MENKKILVDGVQKDVYGIFYIYESKYYFIYTEKEIDENGYVVLYMTQVGKEIINTELGPTDTGNMIGVEIIDNEQQKAVQTSISYIVEDKKNNTLNPQIQYLPNSMISNLKIVSKKRFRLLKNIMINNFKLDFDDRIDISLNYSPNQVESENDKQINSQAFSNNVGENNVIIDYRSKYFEEEEKNKELQAQIDELTQKLNEIKKVIE